MESLQIFIQTPIQTLPLTISPNSTISQIKQTLFPTTTFFTFNGKPLPNNQTLTSLNIKPLSTLTLHFKLPGGGGDGGSTCAESRDCYLNMYAGKKPDKVDPNETRISKWTTCSLSFEPLRPPCVIDKLGNVFNKVALVEALVGKKMPKGFGYIKGLRDMIGVHLSEVAGVRSGSGEEVRFECPVSGLEFNGKYKFYVLRGCGHVLSAKALKEVKSSSCLVCHKEFNEQDKIVVNGSDEEVMELRARMEAEKEAEKVKAREKKEKKVRNGGGSGEVSVLGAKHGLEEGVEDKKLLINNGKEKEKGKIGNGVVAVKGASNESRKRVKTGVVVPANATSEVYASIFTSSRKSDFKETYSCRSLPLGRN